MSKKFPPDIIGDTLMKAQSTLTKLNQVELMKQFIGTLKTELEFTFKEEISVFRYQSERIKCNNH